MSHNCMYRLEALCRSKAIDGFLSRPVDNNLPKQSLKGDK